MMRLSKILAEAGLASRRGSERLIAEGRVTINGRVVTAPGTTADPPRHRIMVDGKPLPSPEPKRYVLLHKPRGYVTSRVDPQGRPVVLDLARAERARLFPVGRLDFDCEGLLLLTNDGELANRLLHPRFGIPRVYEALVEGCVSQEEVGRFRQGVVLEDGVAKPKDVRLLRRTRETTWLGLTFTEGRYRQVKRFCAALGHRVVRLRRVQFGPLRLGRLPVGALRPLTAAELRRLRALGGSLTPCTPGRFPL
ncbi:MAG: rRNA pseudouridine synthase [Candidatus Rokubacteria bacterium]|nr:rRNA pseudouridine synthase [Candidatus Rokubacteria bacterium]